MPTPSTTASSERSGAPQSTPAGGGQPSQEEAAETLKRAGQQVAEAGQQMPAGGESDPLMPESDSPSASESDPLMPESDDAAASSSDMMSDSSSDAAAGGDAGEQAAASDDSLMLPEESGSAGADGAMQDSGDYADAGGSPGEAGDLAEEIQAAQEALIEAGIALQTAGETLETATSDEELAAAEAALGKARLAVIVAGQDLADLGRLMEEGIITADVPDDVLAEAEEALGEANTAIVIATDSIFSTRIQLPDFNPGAGGQGESELDKELNESIAIFEGRILDARNDVIGSSPAPTTAESIPGVAVLGGSTEDMGDMGGEPGTLGEENQEDMPGLLEETQQGRMPEGSEVAATTPQASSIPDDIPPPQGDDIVAQQLREAAIAETDPELRDKLWEEYKRYKAGL